MGGWGDGEMGRWGDGEVGIYEYIGPIYFWEFLTIANQEYVLKLRIFTRKYQPNNNYIHNLFKQ